MIKRVKVYRFAENKIKEDEDFVADEDPLNVVICSYECNEIVIMRTPGNDRELIAGFLYTEGLIKGVDDILEIRELGESSYYVRVNGREKEDEGYSSNSSSRLINSSCGFCGKNYLSKDVFKVNNWEKVKVNTILELPKKLFESQKVFKITGGVHGASLFDMSGEHIYSAEDVGRHNAVDKVIGHLVLNRMIPTNGILQVSGRLGFEIVYKASTVGIPIIIGISAPSSLAIEYAKVSGITLIGFARESRINIYTHPERIEL
ncbi:MAG: formate dehydrogenase accessory sulfurtransferase FdhD [Sulfolobaceae archaeon]|nr:formate dehydrogenase accessory sulfurtransferase FdhD [Sulfolobaceae archaeon]